MKLIEQEKSGAPVLALEGGDAFFKEATIPAGLGPQWQDKADIIASAYGRALDAFVPGELDVVDGVDAFVARVQKHKVPVVAANLVNAQGAPAFPTHVVKTVGKARVLVLGAISEKAWPAGQSLRVTEPIAAIKATLDAAPPHDVAILLAHAPVDEVTTWVKAVPAFSFATVSHSGQMFFQPRTVELPPGGKVASTLVFGSGKGGKYVAKLRAVMKGGTPTFTGGEARSKHRFALETAQEKLQKAPGNSTARAEVDRAKAELWRTERSSYADYDLVGLEKVMPEDPQLARIVTAYNDANAAREAQLAAAAPPMPPGQIPPDSPFVGATTCQACHADAFAAWQKQDHSRAMASLRKSNQQLDRECIGCHTTAYQVPGGFQEPARMGAFAEVQCEACHGPGKAHVQAAGKKGTISRAAGEQTCRKCHTPDATPQFRYEPDRERIRHWKGP